MDGVIVDRDEPIGFEEIEEFIEEVIWIVVKELKKVMNVIVIEEAWAAMMTCWLEFDITCGVPQLDDTVPGAFRDVAAAENVVEVKHTIFEEIDRCDFDVAADRAVH
jgi:hypothetical protein